VKSGLKISSDKYNNVKDGIAIKNNKKLGVTVQTISKAPP
jgi:3-deoxy-D-manno-octulosonate 8-phosphate phosphatase KdsC-like HAD superfamily phosphatase